MANMADDLSKIASGFKLPGSHDSLKLDISKKEVIVE